MSVPSVSTSANQTWQCSARTTGVDLFVIHHAAMTSLSGLVSLMHGDREVSAHFAVKDDQIISTVPPEKRAWSLANEWWDSRAITVETCNSATGDASGWPISEESYESLAKIALWANKTLGVPLDRKHIIGHREVSAMGGSYSTACPGGINIDRVVMRALQLKAGTKSSTPEQIIEQFRKEDNMKIIRTVEDGRCYMVTPNGYTYISNPTDLGLLVAAFDSAEYDKKVHDMNYSKFIKLVSYIHAADTANDADVRSLESKINDALQRLPK